MLGERSEHAIAPNVLDRHFTAEAPNQKWVADFTYFGRARTGSTWPRCSTSSRARVVGWSMQATMTTELVTNAVRDGGVAARPSVRTPAPLGSGESIQHSSEDFRRQLKALGVTCSMSRSGDVWDNSVMESFFSTLKIERVYRKHYATRDAARADVFDYIERFYNPVRRHSTLGNPQSGRVRAGGSSSLTHCPPNPGQLSCRGPRASLVRSLLGSPDQLCRT